MEDEEAVITQANNTDFGLASIFLHVICPVCSGLQSRLNTAMVGINPGAISNAEAPFRRRQDVRSGPRRWHAVTSRNTTIMSALVAPAEAETLRRS
ncbi:hypothetical protein [Agrobacterium pusense]|uniref:hypothetical protein n=1 Tax=Agrobacterium pusense TaxID=648995 RepID=UPI003CC7B07C